MKMKRKHIVPYSLIELLSAMTVFALLMVALMQFLVSAQKIWTGTNAKTEMFEDARIALNLISRDIQSAYYNSTYYGPCHATDSWNSDGGGSGTDSKFDRIDFVAKLSEKPAYSTSSSDKSSSNIAEVRYWWCAKDSDTTKRWRLYRSVVGDALGTTKWNYSSCDNTNWDTIFPDSDANTDTSAGTVNAAAVIPYVVDFTITPLKATLSGSALEAITDQSAFPHAVVITISLLQRSDYEKWQRTGSNPDNNHILVKNNKRTFSKIVLLGDRGQN